MNTKRSTCNVDLSNKSPAQVAQHYGLKPCPFCGGKALFKRKHARAYCDSCGISVSPRWSNEYDLNDAIRYTISKWNTRAELTRKESQPCAMPGETLVCLSDLDFAEDMWRQFGARDFDTARKGIAAILASHRQSSQVKLCAMPGDQESLVNHIRSFDCMLAWMENKEAGYTAEQLSDMASKLRRELMDFPTCQSSQVKPCESVEEAAREIQFRCTGYGYRIDDDNMPLLKSILQSLIDAKVAEARQAQWKPISEFCGEQYSDWQIIAEYEGRPRQFVARWLGDVGGWAIPGICGLKATHFSKPPCPPITDNKEGE